MHRDPRCRRCRAPIRFALNRKSGQTLVFNAEPDPDRGNTVLFADGTCEVKANDAAQIARSFGDELYLSHFATCPKAETFRR